MKYFVTLPSGHEHQVDVVEDASGKVQVRLADGRTLDADAIVPSLPNALSASAIRIGDRSLELWIEGRPPEVGVIADGARFFAKVESERMRIRAATKASGGGEGIVRSPMPGRVVRVLVAQGDDVAAGAPVIVVEAMKMENELVASRAGKVKKVHASAGSTVEGGAALVEIE
ncbi:MAG: biotin/lipoyl-containing protein [Polyangiaceae bacterium]